MGGKINPDGTADLSSALEIPEKNLEMYALQRESVAHANREHVKIKLSELGRKRVEHEGTPWAVGLGYEHDICVLEHKNNPSARDKELLHGLRMEKYDWDTVVGHGVSLESALDKIDNELKKQLDKLSLPDGHWNKGDKNTESYIASLKRLKGQISAEIQRVSDKATTEANHEVQTNEQVLENPYEAQKNPEDRKPYDVTDVKLEVRWQIKKAQERGFWLSATSTTIQSE